MSLHFELKVQNNKIRVRKVCVSFYPIFVLNKRYLKEHDHFLPS